MLLAVVPLYYQLLQAYQPVASNPPPVTETITISPTSSPILPTSAPAVLGTQTQVKKIALLGDSMIDTINLNLCQKSFQKYYPQSSMNFLKYGYGATNIETALDRLTQSTRYLDQQNPSIFSQNPDIIVIESFAYNHLGNSQTSLNRYLQELEKITSAIKTSLPQAKIIMAATIAPNSVTFGNGLSNMHFNALDKIEKTNTIKLYLENFISFSQKNQLPLADAYHPSLINDNGFQELIDPSSNIHLSDLGSEFFCDTLAKTAFDGHLIN